MVERFNYPMRTIYRVEDSTVTARNRETSVFGVFVPSPICFYLREVHVVDELRRKRRGGVSEILDPNTNTKLPSESIEIVRSLRRQNLGCSFSESVYALMVKLNLQPLI